MDFVVTLIASETPLTVAHLSGITRYLDSQGLALSREPSWLAPHRAADLFMPFRPDAQQMRIMRDALTTDRIDLLVNRMDRRRKRLFLADMDSTIIDGETLDDLADFVGRRDETAAITEKTMRGEMDFAAALRERVTLLKGLPESALGQVTEDMRFSAGAETLVAAMRKSGAVCVLVSGGFTVFTGAVAHRAGFHHHHGNVLEIENGVLTGRVREPVLDRDAKLSFLRQYMGALDLAAEDILAIGDGANDLPMLLGAGLGIGYRPKPLLADTLDNLILYGDLTAALYAQGFRKF